MLIKKGLFTFADVMIMEATASPTDTSTEDIKGTPKHVARETPIPDIDVNGLQHANQSLFVIRHGERLDNVDYNWLDSAKRPYDPPLTKEGTQDASRAAREKFLEKDVKYVISSPFLRCLQTAQQVCCSISIPGIHVCNRIVDVFNHCCSIYEQPQVPAEDVSNCGINILQLDSSPLPEYPESTHVGLSRFIPAFEDLADQYWPHNLVIVTHGYGVMKAISLGMGEIHRRPGVYIDYCGHVELTRTRKERSSWMIKHLGGVYEK